jgi:hypothetical protein
MSLRLRRKSECEALCRKRISLEAILGIKPIDYEKCLRFCLAFAVD